MGERISGFPRRGKERLQARETTPGVTAAREMGPVWAGEPGIALPGR
jgi:hypothetical protein